MGWCWGLWLLQVTPPRGTQRQLSPDIHIQFRVLCPRMDGWDSKSDLPMFSEKPLERLPGSLGEKGGPVPGWSSWDPETTDC